MSPQRNEEDETYENCIFHLGCPDFDWPDIYSMAKDLGFDGIEMRGLGTTCSL